MNMEHKLALGVLPPTAVKTVGVSGTYQLAPMETLTGSVELLRLPKPGGGNYFVEYRQPIGVSTARRVRPSTGVLIRTESPDVDQSRRRLRHRADRHASHRRFPHSGRTPPWTSAQTFDDAATRHLIQNVAQDCDRRHARDHDAARHCRRAVRPPRRRRQRHDGRPAMDGRDVTTSRSPPTSSRATVQRSARRPRRLHRRRCSCRARPSPTPCRRSTPRATSARRRRRRRRFPTRPPGAPAERHRQADQGRQGSRRLGSGDGQPRRRPPTAPAQRHGRREVERHDLRRQGAAGRARLPGDLLGRRGRPRRLTRVQPAPPAGARGAAAQARSLAPEGRARP